MTTTMTHLNELLTDDARHDVELTLSMALGAGAVDPRLIEPDHDEPDVEDVIAFRVGGL